MTTRTARRIIADRLARRPDMVGVYAMGAGNTPMLAALRAERPHPRAQSSSPMS